MLSAEELKKILTYNPNTGTFVRKRLNRQTGTRLANRNIQISIYQKRYYAHRLAWLYMTGEWPENLIDHIDRNPSNNRFENLRQCVREQNVQNISLIKASTISGLVGVTWFYPRNKWQARIMLNRKSRSLGYYDSKEEAHAAYVKAKRELHDFYTHKENN